MEMFVEIYNWMKNILYLISRAKHLWDILNWIENWIQVNLPMHVACLYGVTYFLIAAHIVFNKGENILLDCNAYCIQ